MPDSKPPAADAQRSARPIAKPDAMAAPYLHVANRGPWVATRGGRQFFPMDPREEDIDIESIAHALSLICRFNGHVTRFYSVAEHCVLIAEHAQANGVPPIRVLAMLLHDAAEAYIGDMAKPVKVLMPAFCEMEDNIMAVISRKFGLLPTPDPLTKVFDMRILLTERDALLDPSDHVWDLPEELTPLPVVVRGWHPRTARRRFLGLFRSLVAQLESEEAPAHD